MRSAHGKPLITPECFEIYLARPDPIVGGRVLRNGRPCVVISQDESNSSLRTVIVAPMTDDGADYPTRVGVGFGGRRVSVMLDKIRTVDKSRLKKRYDILSESEARQVMSVLNENVLQMALSPKLPESCFEVYSVNLGKTTGSEIRKTRPCAVLSPPDLNAELNTVIIAPMTSQGSFYPTRVRSHFQDKNGLLILDQIRVVGAGRLVRAVGKISRTETEQVINVLGKMFPAETSLKSAR